MFFLTLEKCSITSYTLKGISPPSLWLPRCDKTRKGNSSLSQKAQGRYGGTAVPLPLSAQSFVFYVIARGILQSRFF